MASADFCMFSAVFLIWPRLLLSERSMQISPGTTRFFPSIYLPHLSRMIPCSYWASACRAVLPSCETFYVVSVRQARGLPARVDRFPLTSGFLQIPLRSGHPCLRLYPSHYRAGSGLSPVRNVRRRAHPKIPCRITLARDFLIPGCRGLTRVASFFRQHVHIEKSVH